MRRTSALKAVFDTNIILRMVMTRPETVAGKLQSAMEAGAFQIVLSPALLQEMQETLRSKEFQSRHPRSETVIQNFLYRLMDVAIMVPGILSLDIPALQERDADDMMVLAAAVEGEAAFLVTQDKDLLDIGSWRGIQIVEPPEFYRQLRALQSSNQESSE